MGLRGPARTPLEIVKKRGNPGHRPINDRAPKPAAKKPTPSPAIKANPKALKIYRRLAKWTWEMGVLRVPDGLALEKLAVLEADWEEMSELISRSGFVIRNPKTKMAHINPLLKQRDALQSQLWRGYREFGITPAARVNLQTEREPGRSAGRDDWSDF